MSDIESQVLAIAQAAKKASGPLGLLPEMTRNQALRSMAGALRMRSASILEANAADVEAARAAGTKESLIDRLLLTPERIEDMAKGLESLVSLPDPLGKHLEDRTLYNGIELEKVTVPLGVVAVIYEARPNVTADAVGICLKSGNAVVLRGGSLAAQSNKAIAQTLSQAATIVGIPNGSIGYIDSTDRAATDILMGLRGIVDVLIPRGGAGLIEHCVENAKVPVIETGTGNCHVYVHKSANLNLAKDVVMNAKCRRFGVCNAAETLLVDAECGENFLPMILPALAEAGVTIHGCPITCAFAEENGVHAIEATEEDWKTEYLGPEIAVRVVRDINEAIEHVNKYGTKHSESIIACNYAACEMFFARVDAACVYSNASTAFTDGGQFGLGAEIGISTQKLHVRGPFALEGLTSYKYLLSGQGQTRS